MGNIYDKREEKIANMYSGYRADESSSALYKKPVVSDNNILTGNDQLIFNAKRFANKTVKKSEDSEQLQELSKNYKYSEKALSKDEIIFNAKRTADKTIKKSEDSEQLQKLPKKPKRSDSIVDSLVLEDLNDKSSFKYSEKAFTKDEIIFNAKRTADKTKKESDGSEQLPEVANKSGQSEVIQEIIYNLTDVSPTDLSEEALDEDEIHFNARHVSDNSDPIPERQSGKTEITLKPRCEEKGVNNEIAVRRIKKSPYLISVEMLFEHSYAKYDNQLYRYMEKKGFWKLITESDARHALRHDISADSRDSVTKHIFTEIYDWLLSDCTTMPPPHNEDWFNFLDVSVNWKTGEITKNRKDLFFTNTLNLEYGKLTSNKGCYSQFKDFVFDGDKDTENEFKKFIGLCLSNIRNLKYCFFLYGPSNTGKSVVLNFLKLLIGEDYCSSVSFSQMSNEFAITQLIGKRLNISGEVSGTTNKRLDIFKSLTGNDRITVSFKCKDHFQFSNKCLLTFACNTLSPMVTANDTDSFMSRVVIFPFRNIKPRSEWISNLEELIFMDSKAIIDDAFEGLRLLEKDSFQFCESKAMKRCKREFYLQNDSFTIFADKYIVADPESIVSSESIRKAYTHFCHVEDCPSLKENQYIPMLKMKYDVKPTYIDTTDEYGHEKRNRGYEKIRLNYPVDDIEEFWP